MRWTLWPGLVLVCWMGVAGAQMAPARGMLLVAQPSLTERNFARTVVLLLHHGEDGSLGLILNRPTDVGAREMLGDLAELNGYDEPVFIGGPAAPTAVAILARGAPGGTERTPPQRPIVGDIYVHSDLALLSGITGREARARVRLYAGHAAWQPEQLEQEIARGDWQVVPGTAGQVLTDAPLALWDSLLDYPSGPLVRRMSPREQPIMAGHVAPAGGLPYRHALRLLR